MNTNPNQNGSTTPEECTAEIDIRNKATGDIRIVRVFTEKEALAFRPGMVISETNPPEFVDSVWFFPDTIGRDYPLKGEAKYE